MTKIICNFFDNKIKNYIIKCKFLWLIEATFLIILIKLIKKEQNN